jgi:hypothetical protein
VSGALVSAGSLAGGVSAKAGAAASKRASVNVHPFFRALLDSRIIE